jgi:hypothetical protein
MRLLEATTSLEQHKLALSAQLDQWAKTHNFTLQVITSIITSLIAGLIFWLFFSYLPWRARRKKLRPIVELALYDVYGRLFSVFDAIMRGQPHSPSHYQAEIRSGKLTEEQIGIGLANKCLNESYLYDEKVRGSLMVIGRTIFDDCFAIDEVADKIISFNTHASAREVLLIEKIREQVRKYHFSERQMTASAKITLGQAVLYPVDPTISYRRRNFYEIYKLFCELQDIVLNKRPLDRDRFIYKMQHLFYSGQYSACRKLIRANGQKFSSDGVLYNGYLALCERGLGNTKRFYEIIRTTYKLRPYDGSLVSSRSMFKNLMEDNKLLEILAESHSAEEIAALKQSVRQDSEHKVAFEGASKALSKYFRDKAANVLGGATEA